MIAILSLALSAQQEPGAGAAVALVQLLDNGDASVVREDPRPGGIPWWRSSGAATAYVAEHAGERWLATPAGARLDQPIAAFGPALARAGASIVIRGRIVGEGTLTLTGASGERLARAVGGPHASRDAPASFEWSTADLRGRPLEPRLTLELAGSSDRETLWDDLEVWVPLPAPDTEALRAELVGVLDEIYRTYVTLWRDDLGERPTAFLVKPVDIVTGEPIYSPAPGSINQVYESLLDSVAVEDHADWGRWLDAFLSDYLELGFHAETGLPQKYDGVADAPLADLPVEIGRDLEFLLAVHERGPEAHRALALARAQRIGETVLTHGRLPDGSLAAKYVPRDASPRLDVIPLRSLNVAAPLTRLGALTGDPRMLDAARIALGQLEYTLYWGGHWREIDPDFDDSFGNWGARAVDMLASYPDEEVFRRFTRHGFEHFAPLWADSLRFGGSTAADQVRCWKALGRYADLAGDAAVRAEFDALLRAAVRVHFKGEQYDNGAWGDVTVANFDPKTGLNVGDLDGAPQNLLEGLAFAHARSPSIETRAMFTAVLRASAAAYRRPYGWLKTRYQLDGLNEPGGEQRVLPGLVAMLASLRE